MARLIREDLDKYFDYGVYVPTRTIYIGSCTDTDAAESGTDYKMSERAVKALHILDQTTGQINIVLNNLGGDCYHGLAIYDAIKACQNEVSILGTGSIMSMGAIILQAGDYRILTPNACVMWHPGEGEAIGHPMNVRAWAKEDDRLWTVLNDIVYARMLEKHSDLDRPSFDAMFMFDKIMPADMAVEFGLADSILS